MQVQPALDGSYIIAYAEVKHYLNRQERKAPGDGLGIGIQAITTDQFVTNGKYCCFHCHSCVHYTMSV
jgi:hypothetical protein